MRLVPAAATLLAAAMLAPGLAACTSGATPAGPSAVSQPATPPAVSQPATPSATAPAAPSAAAPSGAATSANPDGGLLTGAQLKGLLEPASYFPPGYRRQRAGTRDTGTGYEPPSTAGVRKPKCRLLGATSWTSITGINGVSFAQDDYIDKARSTEIAQEIDVYPGSTARAVMRRLGAISAVCPSYTDPQTGSRAEVREQASPRLGEGGYVITVTDPAWRGGTTLVAARAGTAVVTVLSTDGADNGRASAVRLARALVSVLRGAT
jgi:hypothetical protein